MPSSDESYAKRLPEFKGLVAFPVFIEIGLVFSVPEYKIERNECISSEMSKRKGTRGRSDENIKS